MTKFSGIAFMTINHGNQLCQLGRRMVMKINGVWHQKDLITWRKLKCKPKIDFDATQRWFGYSEKTMMLAREEAAKDPEK